MSTGEVQGIMWMFIIIPIWLSVFTLPASVVCLVLYLSDKKDSTLTTKSKRIYSIIGVLGLLPLIIAFFAFQYLTVAQH